MIGIKVLDDYKVLVKMEDIGDTIGESKTIIMPETTKERLQAQVDKGEIVMKAETAFKDREMNPKIGDRVAMTKYPGEIFIGDDKEEYRIMNDRDVIAILEKP